MSVSLTKKNSNTKNSENSSKPESNPPSSITLQKKSLRAQLTALRKNMFQPEVSKDHFRKLESQSWFQRSKNIAIYISQPFEFPTQDLFVFCCEHGKKVFAPVVTPTSMNFHLVESWEKLTKNEFEIHEPTLGNRVESNCMDAFFVPMLGFDWNGSRLGRGKGYYDILFSDPLLTAKRIGLAFEYQSVLHVPHTVEDQPMDFIFTEKELRKIL